MTPEPAAVSAREAERHSLPLWPLVERVPLGEWELRSDPAPVGRLIKRANSCLAMGDPGVPVVRAAEVVRRFYRERDRPAMVQVERGSQTERDLAALGWVTVPGGDAHFLLAPLAEALGRLGADGDVSVAEDGPRAHAARFVDDAEVGSGRAALDDGWLAVHTLTVEPSQRRRGHGTALLAGLLRWGAARGATTAWLHVEVDNVPALAMYDGLGFTRHHTCRYLRTD